MLKYLRFVYEKHFRFLKDFYKTRSLQFLGILFLEQLESLYFRYYLAHSYKRSFNIKLKY
jgi:hypothetical protein